MSGLEIFYAFFIIGNFLLSLSWTAYAIWKNFFVHPIKAKSKVVLILILLIVNFLAIGAFALEIVSFVFATTSFEVSVLVPIWLAFSAFLVLGLSIFFFHHFQTKLIASKTENKI